MFAEGETGGSQGSAIHQLDLTMGSMKLSHSDVVDHTCEKNCTCQPLGKLVKSAAKKSSLTMLATAENSKKFPIATRNSVMFGSSSNPICTNLFVNSPFDEPLNVLINSKVPYAYPSRSQNLFIDFSVNQPANVQPNVSAQYIGSISCNKCDCNAKRCMPDQIDIAYKAEMSNSFSDSHISAPAFEAQPSLSKSQQDIRNGDFGYCLATSTLIESTPFKNGDTFGLNVLSKSENNITENKVLNQLAVYDVASLNDLNATELFPNAAMNDLSKNQVLNRISECDIRNDCQLVALDKDRRNL